MFLCLKQNNNNICYGLKKFCLGVLVFYACIGILYFVDIQRFTSYGFFKSFLAFLDF